MTTTNKGFINKYMQFLKYSAPMSLEASQYYEKRYQISYTAESENKFGYNVRITCGIDGSSIFTIMTGLDLFCLGIKAPQNA